MGAHANAVVHLSDSPVWNADGVKNWREVTIPDRNPITGEFFSGVWLNELAFTPEIDDDGIVVGPRSYRVPPEIAAEIESRMRATFDNDRKLNVARWDKRAILAAERNYRVRRQSMPVIDRTYPAEADAVPAARKR